MHFLEALYAHVVCTAVGIANEWEPAEALMDMPKEIFVSASVEEGLWQCEEGTGCSCIFWGLSPAGVALQLGILVLWGMNIKTRLTHSSGAWTVLSVSAVQSSARSGWLEWLILLNQNNWPFFEIQVRLLNSSPVISCAWPESWRAHPQMFFLKLTKEAFTGFAGSRCQGILNKQIGKICFVLLTRSDPNYLWIYTGGVD